MQHFHSSIFQDFWSTLKIKMYYHSVQSLSRVQLFVTPWTIAHQASLSIPNSPSLPKLMSIESVMPSKRMRCHPLSSLSPPALNLSQHQGLFKWVSWPRYWRFSFNISASNEHPGLILLEDGLVGFPCSTRDSQESSPTPQFKSINSSVLSFFCRPTLTSIHDYWKNNSLD